MHARHETDVGCDPPKQAGEVNAFIARQPREHVGLEPLGHALDPTKLRQPRLGRHEVFAAPIVWIWNAADQPSILELVEQQHQATRVSAEVIRQRTLGEVLGLGREDPQDPYVLHRETEGLETSRKVIGRMGADLGHEVREPNPWSLQLTHPYLVA